MASSGVILQPVAEPVGLPVHQVESAFETEDQINEALQESLDRIESQPAKLRRHGGRPAQLPEQLLQTGRRHSPDREIKLHLVETVLERDLRQGEILSVLGQRKLH